MWIVPENVANSIGRPHLRGASGDVPTWIFGHVPCHHHRPIGPNLKGLGVSGLRAPLLIVHNRAARVKIGLVSAVPA